MAKNSRVTDTLIQVKYDNMLRKPVEAEDIFSQFRGDIIGENVLPGTPFVVVKSQGQTSMVMGLIKSLSSAITTGRDSISGDEEKTEMLDFTAYTNEVKHGVNADKFGIDALANKPYKVLDQLVPLLGEYMEKYKGLHRRESLCQVYSSNLVSAPSSRTQHINSNFFVGGVAIGSQPAYSDTLATYAANINTAIPDTASGNTMSLDNIKILEKWLRTQKRIKPLKNGKYIVTVPTNQKYNLMDEDTGLGKLTLQSGNTMNLKNWITEWSRLIFVEDIRSPMLTATDGASSTLVWTYTSVDDSRPTVGADNWDVSFVLGADGVVEYEGEQLHLERDNTVEYGRENRVAAFANYGCQLLQWSDGTDVMLNYGSAIAIWNSAE